MRDDSVSPVRVQVSTRRKPKAGMMSPMQLVESCFSAALPVGLVSRRTTSATFGYRSVNPLPAKPIAPAMVVPSIAGMTFSRSAGGAPA